MVQWSLLNKRRMPTPCRPVSFRLGSQDPRRLSSATGPGSSSTTYVDQWLSSIRKPKEFYKEQARLRNYFYNVDLNGRLYLEEIHPKNLTSCIKDTNFLRFFFSRLRPYHHHSEFSVEYPYMSLCGKERNFVRPVASPIVFTEMVTRDDDNQLCLLYGGGHQEVFDRHQMAVCATSGRLYHSTLHAAARYGLIRSSLAVSLSNDMVLDDTSGRLIYQNANRNDPAIEIPYLPTEHEPGSWAMPYVEDD